MKKISITLSFLLFIISGITLVGAIFINFETKVQFKDSSSKNIIAESDTLNKVIIFFESNEDMSDAVIHSSCNIKTDFLLNQDSLYYFQMTLLDTNCDNPNFHLKKGEEIYVESNFQLNIQKRSDIFGLIIDYPTKEIQTVKKEIDKTIKSYSIYNKLKEKKGLSYFSLLKKQRIFKELNYKQDIVISVLNKREQKYSVPVKGFKIATGLNVIPNASRNYRKNYTDGIHHGWDIMAPEGTPVSAIDDGIIIRVVKDFSYEDIANMKKSGDISETEKLRNLDILRGNQVWLKTMKGDVIFYSHLKDIYNHIEEGVFLSVGEDIGTIGKSGVPDRNYTNFHLHFPIQKNPYNLKKVGTYSLEDYMNWDWYLKGLNPDEVVKGQKEIFSEDVKFVDHMHSHY